MSDHVGRGLRGFILLGAMALALQSIAAVAQAEVRAPRLTNLHNFGGATGSGPRSSLIADATGALYGTALAGGAYNRGTVFKLTPPAGGTGAWVAKTLYSFQGGAADGSFPNGGLVRDPYGRLYGTTLTGGAYAIGTVFKLTPPPGGGAGAWVRTILHSFRGGNNDGHSPYGSLVMANGVLYGTTEQGGSNNKGTVFRLTPIPGNALWKLTLLYKFRGGVTDGANPRGGLLRGANGVLYGTTVSGGGTNCIIGCGIAFKLTPPAAGLTVWKKATIHRFLGLMVGQSADAGNPYGKLIMDNKGAVYGTTWRGGSTNMGTVFKLTPRTGNLTWTRTILHAFAGGANGASPYAGLLAGPSGVLFGTTQVGGVNNGGTLFKLTPPVKAGGAWTKTVLHTFRGGNGDGTLPFGELIARNGVLYGTASKGGGANQGIVFKQTTQ